MISNTVTKATQELCCRSTSRGARCPGRRIFCTVTMMNSGGIGIRNALNHDRFIGKADLKCMEETQFCQVDTQSGWPENKGKESWWKQKIRNRRRGHKVICRRARSKKDLRWRTTTSTSLGEWRNRTNPALKRRFTHHGSTYIRKYSFAFDGGRNNADVISQNSNEIWDCR